jgi:hypothetical protein
MKTDKNKDEEKDSATESTEQQFVSFEWAIREVLCYEENFDVIEGFMSELLKQPVKIINFMENRGSHNNYKWNSDPVYLLTEGDAGKFNIIELVFTFEQEFMDDILTKKYTPLARRMLQIGDNLQIGKVYSIFVLHFDNRPCDEFMYSGMRSISGVTEEVALYSRDMMKETFGKFDTGNIETTYYMLMKNKFRDIPQDTLDEWLYFLKHNKIKDSFSAKGLLKARDILRLNLFPPENRTSYMCQQIMIDLRSRHEARLMSEDESESDEEYINIIEKMYDIVEEQKEIQIEKNEIATELGKIEKEFKKILKEMKKPLSTNNEKLMKAQEAIRQKSEKIEARLDAFYKRSVEFEERVKQFR